MVDENVNLIIRTADKTKKAEVTLPRVMTVADLIDASKKNWALPTDTEYQLVNVTRGRQLLAKEQLTSDQVQSGDELEIQPFFLAGGLVKWLILEIFASDQTWKSLNF